MGRCAGSSFVRARAKSHLLEPDLSKVEDKERFDL